MRPYLAVAHVGPRLRCCGQQRGQASDEPRSKTGAEDRCLRAFRRSGSSPFVLGQDHHALGCLLTLHDKQVADSTQPVCRGGAGCAAFWAVAMAEATDRSLLPPAVRA